MINNPCLINQISVFLKNQPGNLSLLTRYLADKKIRLYALSVAETHDFGAARLIVEDPEACKAALSEMHYIFLETNVLAVEIDNTTGGIAEMLETLAYRDMNIEYVYSMFAKKEGSALIIIRVPRPEEACEAFQARKYKLLTMKDIASL